MAVTPDDRPVTGVAACTAFSDPFPSAPRQPSPQHFTAPAVVSAQTTFDWPAAASVAIPVNATPVVESSTAVGMWRAIVVPSPITPSLFVPQHFTVPVVITAQASSFPTATFDAPEEIA